ncbi:ribosome biogenesis protein BMS1 homolog [Callithrix jacchus]
MARACNPSTLVGQAEEAFASEDESEESSSLSAEEEDSENQEALRKKLLKPSEVGSGQKLGSRNLIDETSDTEDLLKEEEDYKEERNDPTETSVIDDNEEDDDDTREELGGLLRVNQPDRECKQKAASLDCSRFLVEAPHDWDLEEI